MSDGQSSEGQSLCPPLDCHTLTNNFSVLLDTGLIDVSNWTALCVLSSCACVSKSDKIDFRPLSWELLYFTWLSRNLYGSLGHAPLMTLQPALSIFSCSPQPCESWRTPAHPVHIFMLSSHLFFFCLPLLLPPLTLPCKMFFARPDDRETWPYHFRLRFLTVCQEVFVWSDGSLSLVAGLLVGNTVFVCDVQDLPKAPRFHGL